MSDESEGYDASEGGSDFESSPIAAAKRPAAKAAAKPRPTKKAASVSQRDENNDDEEGGKTKNAVGKTQTIEEAYQKLTQLQHVLKRPDTYIGSTKVHEQEMWVWDPAAEKMALRSISFPPGLYKIFDEILVNAADNAQRSTTVPMKNIKVTIDQAAGSFCVWNDGQGIPVEMHKKENMYVPEMIFGELLTGTNFNDDIAKVVGGRNGFGAKLANIFSTEFSIECVDSTRGKKYQQSWRDNMGSKSAPNITGSGGKADYVEVRFRPDLARFSIDAVSDDLMALLAKRVYDIAGCNPKVTVWLNGKKIGIKTFKDYVNLYPLDRQEDGKPFALVYEAPHERWEVAATVSTAGTFHQVSFVNSIATYEGGQHVAHVVDAVTKALEEKLNPKSSKSVPITKPVIKQHLWVFIRCLIENPAFGSQTKEKLTSKTSEFGSRCKLSDEFVAKLAKGGIKEYVLRFANFKAQKSLKTKGGKKVDRLRGIEKLDDANKAGTKEARNCTLIVTEGDSAKTLAVCGLAVVGRDYYGVFPLRGKLLNVRGAKVADLLKNKEIGYLVKILGLKYQHKYDSVDSLRYGKLMVMADQDVDGSHIKGLILNFIDVHWPELLKLGFVVEFITPIVKARKGKEVRAFFTLPEYEAWKATPAAKGWTIKYYKGLGTSERDEAREYFQDLKKHRVQFKYRGEMDHQLLDMAFGRDKVEDRKTWINGADPKQFLSTTQGAVTVGDFINHELVHFSVESVHRSIPHVMDGFKPSQRKVLYGVFKRNLVKPIKVAQLAGYVSEKAAYHHGEASLQECIIGMAQNYVGANNVNLLYPEGQFGSRLLGGKDASAARYIFTKMAPITRTIFHPADDALLKYLEDDGYPVEPEFYVPILPMLLINGAAGIGTGWSTSVPNYNPRDVVANLRRLLRGDEPEPMHPWYLGFRGTIEQRDWSVAKTRNQYEVRGVYALDGVELSVTELPVGTWTQSYKDFIEENLADAPTPKGSFFADYKEYHTDSHVDFQVTLVEDKLSELQGKGLEKSLKLVSALSVNNLMAFGTDGKIKKYESVVDILKDFYQVRLEYYGKRKEHLAAVLTEEWEILDNKVRFIEAVIADECKVRGKAKKAVHDELVRCGFKKFAAKKKKRAAAKDEDDDGEDFEDEAPAAADDGASYDYLLRLAIWTLTREKADQLRAQRDAKRKELDVVLAVHPKQMWSEDLDAFLAAYDAFEQEIVGASSGSDSTRNINKSKPRTKAGKTAAAAAPVAAAATKKKAETVAPTKVAAKKVAPTSPFLAAATGPAGDGDDEQLNDSDLDLLNMDEADLLQYSAEKPKKPVSQLAAAATAAPVVVVKAAAAPKAAAVKKAAVAAPKPKAKPKKRKADDDDDDDEPDDQFEDDFDDFDEAPPKKKSPPKKAAVAVKPAATKPAAKPVAAPKAVVAAAAAAPKAAAAEAEPRKARAARKAAIIVSDDEDEDGNSMELDDDDSIASEVESEDYSE